MAVKIIKDSRQSLLLRVFGAKGKLRLAVSALCMFRLAPEAPLAQEPELWATAQGALGDVALDEGLPKPCGEVLVKGGWFSPGGKPRDGGQASFRVGGVSRSFYVFGPRRWEGGVKSKPEPTDHVPLTWEYAFGGPGFEDNPAGRGFKGDEPPQVEDPKAVITSPGDRPPPICPLPLDPSLPERRAKAGTYDEKWLERRWPFFPDDFDWSWCCRAQPPQRLKDYFRGDEPVEAVRMHPDKERLEASLPGLRARLFALRDDGESGPRFEEMTARLDTVWLFPDLEAGICVFRGAVDVRDEEYTDLPYLYAAFEPLASAPASGEEHFSLFQARLKEYEAGAFVMPVDPVEETEKLKRELLAEMDRLKAPLEDPKFTGRLPAGVNLDTALSVPEAATAPGSAKASVWRAAQLPREAEGWKRYIYNEYRKTCEHFGQDPAKLMAEAKAKPQPGRGEMFDGLKDWLRKNKLMTPEMESQFAKADQAFLSLDKHTAGAAAVSKAQPPPDPSSPGAASASLAFSGLDFLGMVKPPKPDEEILQEVLDNPPPDGEFQFLDTATREEVEAGHARGESFAGRDLTGVDLSGLRLAGIDLRRACLERCDLTGTVLAGANLRGALLSGIKASDADFSGADLSRAVMAGAVASQAIFREARLTAADLSESDATGADFRGARMGDASLEKTQLHSATFSNADLRRAAFVNVDLTGADLSSARLKEASFDTCILERADFSAASAKAAGFTAVKAVSASFHGADLKGAAFRQCRLEDCDLATARLNEANAQDSDFSGSSFVSASLRRANFSGCVLHGCDLEAVRGRLANLAKTDLTDCRLAGADLFQGSIQQARLQRTDFRGANLFGAEVRDAEIGQVDFTGANLAQTKISDWRDS